MKSRRKLLSILLTLSLLVTLLVPMVGPASAATTNLVTATPTFTQNAGNQALGNVWLYENDDQAGSVFSVYAAGPPVVGRYDVTVTILTSGVEFQAAATNGTIANYMAPLASLANNRVQAGDITVLSATTKTYTARVQPTNVPGGTPKSGLQLPFAVNITGATAGPIEVEVSAPDTGITGGKFVIGNIAGTGTNTVLLDDETIQIGSTNAVCGLLRVEEQVTGSLVNGDMIRLDLPSNMTWNAGTVVAASGVTVGAAVIETSPAGYSRLRIPVTAAVPAGGSRGMVTITPHLDIDDDAAAGDINVSVSGNSSNVSSANIVIGQVAQYGATVEAVGDPKNIIAGAIDQEMGNFRISEGVAASLLANRTVLVEVPSYVKWFSSDPSITREKGDGNLTVSAAGGTSDDARHTKKYTVTQSNTASKFLFERNRVTVDADAPEGDVTVKFSGTGGLTGEVVLAKVVKPVSATAGNDKVLIGTANQAVADVTITEGLKGAIQGNPSLVTNATKAALTTNPNQQGYLIIDAPSGVTFAEKPTVEVTSGNIDIEKDSITLQNQDNQLSIRIKTGSTEASTIKLSNIKLTLDRTVPEGPLKLGITGSAVDRVTFRNAAATNDTDVAKVVVANVATPAPTDQKATSVFKIGDTKFTVNGVETTMDVAPYIKEDRTYMPLRFVAQAAGVSDSNIMWNQADQSVILIKGDRVVKLTIGDKTMFINGVAFTMDVAPELVDPGRTMLPLRAVAQALGCDVQWDAATQSVTVN